MTMVINTSHYRRLQPSSNEPHTLRPRKRFVSMDERNSVSSVKTSIASRTIEDSMQGWEDDDDDDEYSCNTSSDRSDPQLLDDDANIVRRSATTNYRNDPMIIADDDNDTQSINTHRPSYESANHEIPKQPYQSKQKMSFCWLPNRTSDVTSSNGNVPYHNHIYIGIPHNPPIVCAEGKTRGNVRSLHRKAWLEVSDSQHRYGKHLRMYYRHWESLYVLIPGYSSTLSETFSRGSFFDWLDSKGKYNGQALPEIPDCPRSLLDSDTVTYIDDLNESQQYAARVVTTKNGFGRLVFSDGNGCTIRTGNTGWMFVIRDNVMYVAPKVINNGMCIKRFHHSSFFGGRAVQAAGIIITDESNGYIKQVLPHSGHYRPGESDIQRVLYFLHTVGVCWTTFSVDIQQFLFIDRSNHSTSPTCSMKKKKLESLHLRSAVTVADFLSHKARCLQPHGIFATIEARRYTRN